MRDLRNIRLGGEGELELSIINLPFSSEYKQHIPITVFL